MKNPNHDSKLPSRPEINGEKTTFISLSELKAKEEPTVHEEPKSHKAKVYGAVAVILVAAVATTYTIQASKKKALTESSSFEESPASYQPRRTARTFRPATNPNLNQPQPAGQTYPNGPAYPSYPDGNSSPSQYYNSYPDEADRMPANSDYEVEPPIEGEPLVPQEEYVPSEEYVEQ